MELVSVIIPVYNVENFLAKCLDSVLKQTYKNLEILVVNDGSTDHSLEICEEYAKKDQRIKVFNQANQGLSGARNTALKEATGDYVYFLDSDDYLANNTIEMMVKMIGDADIAESATISVDENGVETPYKYRTIENISDYNLQDNRRMLAYVALFVGGHMYRHDFIKGLEFPIGLIHEDVYYSTILFEKVHRIVYVPEATYYYFQRSDSIMNSRFTGKIYQMYDVLKSLYQYYEEHNFRNYDFLEKVYVRNLIVAVLYQKGKKIDKEFYDIREAKSAEAMQYFKQHFKNYRANPLLTSKEKIFVTLFKYKWIRHLLWR